MRAMDEESLSQLMTQNGVDLSAFGIGEAKTLYELAQEITRGESHLSNADLVLGNGLY
jgi:hypothetical protein